MKRVENYNGCKSITMIMTKAKIKISNDGIQQKMRTCSYTRHRKDKKAKIKIEDNRIQGKWGYVRTPDIKKIKAKIAKIEIDDDRIQGKVRTCSKARHGLHILTVLVYNRQ